MSGAAAIVGERILPVVEEPAPLLAAVGWYLLWQAQPFLALAVVALVSIAAVIGATSLLLGRAAHGWAERVCRALVVVGAVLATEALLVTLAPGLVAAAADALLGHL